MKAIKFIVIIFISATLFTACDKEEDSIQANEINKSQSNSKDSKIQKSGFLTEEELIDYIENMDDETAIEVQEESENQYSVNNDITFDEGNINNPPNTDMVWLYPSQIADALEEAIALALATGCARMDVGYGYIAVNGC